MEHSTILRSMAGSSTSSRCIRPISGQWRPWLGGTSAFLFALPIARPNLVSHRMVFGHESGHAVTDAVGKNDTDDTDSEWEALHTLRHQRQADEGEALHLRI